MMKKRDYSNATFRGVTPEERRAREAVVRALYRTHTRPEIVAMTGLSSGTVGTLIRRLGLQHDEATKQRLSRWRAAVFPARITPEVQQRASEARKRVYRSEVRRVLQGLPQRTKMKVRTRPLKMICAINNLRIRYGYVPDPDDNETLLYDENTRRRLKGAPDLYFADEEHYTKKYHIKFKPLRQEDNEREGTD